MSFAEQLVERARNLEKRIVLPETEDERTLKAAEVLVNERIVDVVLVGDPDKITSDAKDAGADVSGCEIISPSDKSVSAPLAEKLYQLRKAKGMTQEQAEELIKDYLYFGTMLLKEGRVDGYVGGASHTTSDNLRPALQVIKARPGLKTVSSFFLMIHPDPKWGENGVMLYSDCGMVEMPTAEQLADIAAASAKTFNQLVNAEPRVAMLSYSTKGSASSPDTEKVLRALALVKENAPDLVVDGEMQVDAALIPSVGERKCKGSPVAGKANCLIFPDLDAGNIGYKITERLGGAQALGPLVQGMAKPTHDLSRGCSVDDIVKVCAVAAVMAE
ncbi:MAG: phosphate acetyltransferase [Verrucomicrobia bacterium]|nr:phosphate acetyltransferase [Verrucomicrobiota bacterium]